MKTTDDQVTAEITTHPTIRAARPEELVDAARTYQAAARELRERQANDNPWSSEAARAQDLQAAIRLLGESQRYDPKSVLVAVDDDRLVGVAAVRVQDAHAHIQFLFVDPASQGAGVGRALVDALHTHAINRGATVFSLAASRDPRAWHRYLALGLHPGPPTLCFRASSPQDPGPGGSWNLAESPVNLHAPGSLHHVDAIDVVIRGSRRRHDIERWLANGTTGALVHRPADPAPIGYYLVNRSGRFLHIGPVAALDAGDFGPVLQRALAHAATVGTRPGVTWRIDMPGANTRAIRSLMDAGFRLASMVHWFESAPIGRWDRYIFRDEDEL